MMRKLGISIVVIFLILGCQKEIGIAEIGKEVPNYRFTNILNSSEKNLSIGDLKGKVVILEFWATWCTPCIPAMKKLDTLQTQFKDDLEIITVSPDDKKRLERFIKTTQTKLRVAHDTAHQNSFKYKKIPHSIIIDKEGIVRAITAPENINKKVIEELLTVNKIALKVKNDFYIDPLLEVENLKAISNSDYRIEFTGYDQKKRAGSKLLINIDGNINGIEMWNNTLPRLYQSLFDIPSSNRLVFKDGLSYDDFASKKEDLYNLTIEVSREKNNKWRQIGIDFLNQYFESNARRSTKKMLCYVLKNEGNILKKSNSEESDYMFMGPIFKMKKQKMKKLTGYLEGYRGAPIVDQTNLTEVYDLNLDWQEESPETLLRELKKYGLTLEKSKTKIPVEVIEIYKKAK